MLNVEELFELEENIKEELDDHLTAALSRMNRSGQLEDFLRLLGMEHLLHKESGYEVYKTGKIVVIGQSDVKPEVLLSIAKQLGLDKKRFELYLEYEDAMAADIQFADGWSNATQWLWKRRLWKYYFCFGIGGRLSSGCKTWIQRLEDYQVGFQSKIGGNASA